MVKVDKIIVTVVLSKHSSIDLELPAFLTIGELSTKVLEIIKVIYPEKWSDVFDIGFVFMGHPLNVDATLAACGVWDGAYLMIERRC